MARLPRISAADLPHHVMQLGNNQQPIFLDDVDRQSWRQHLRESSLTAGVDVHAYVQMDNHIHLLATPRGSAGALSTMMQSLGRRYVAEFNRRHGRSGTLWEGRFRAALVEPGPAVLACMRYIDTNPQRAGRITDAQAFQWSSMAHHLGRRRDPLVTDPPAYWSLGNTPFDREAAYLRFIEDGTPAAEALALSQATRRGWPIGSEGFKRQLKSELGMSVAPLPRGRPRRPASPPGTAD